MKRNFIFPLLLCTIALTGLDRPDTREKSGIRFFVDPATNSDDPEEHMAYGLNVTPPWPDGGYFFINLPEHLWFMPGTKGIARHHDKRKNVWQISKDGKMASYDVESVLTPGVRLSVKAVAKKDRVNFEMTLKNNSSLFLENIGPLFCFQYHHLKGFPLKRTDNFDHTFIVFDGKPVALSEIKVDSMNAVARMAQVKDCNYEANWWAEKMGGMIDKRIDFAVTALTSSSGDRNVIVSWTPGKSILSNTVIPCIHADPCIGSLSQGESRTVHGVLIFTRNPIASVVKELAQMQ